MSNNTNNRRSWRAMIPRGGLAVFGVILVAVVAFSLGGFFFGGDQSGVPAATEREEPTSSKPTVWTCSMHPQIRLPKPGKCPICSMDLIPIETDYTQDVGPRQIRMSEAAKQLARIETSPVSRAFAQVEIRMVGKIVYDEARVAYITAWVPGRLDKLFVDFTGAQVAKGDHMVHIYSPELIAAQEELIQSLEAVQALEKGSSVVLRTTADETLIASREKLRLYGLSEEQIQQIETSRKASDYLTIKAPIGGFVVHKDAKEGMYVSTGTRIYTIADLSKLWVVFEAYESDLPWLRYGQQIAFTSPSFPGETFHALISFLDPVVDPRTRTVRVRAVVDNKKFKLKPDMFIQGVVKSQIDGDGNVINENLAGKWISPMHPKIVKNGPGKCDVCGMDLVPAESLGYAGKALTMKEAPLLIPASAPLVTGKRAVVYVEVPNDDGPLFEGREVKLGPRAGNFYVVRSGLKEGERVVTNGAFKIDSELQIQAKPSMMSPKGGQVPSTHQHGHEGGTVPAADETKREHAAKEPQPVRLNREALNALTPLYEAYFDVQMALASDDPAAAAKGYHQLADKVAAVGMSLFTVRTRDQWVGLAEPVKLQAEAGASLSDLTAERKVFFQLSGAMIELHQAFGHPGKASYYLTFCPMYNNGKGAYWLQTVDTVYNSFYGASMLRCGEIKETLAADAGKVD